MIERLRGWVGYTRTVPIDHYKSCTLEYGEEFWLDEKSVEEASVEFRAKIEKHLRGCGLIT